MLHVEASQQTCCYCRSPPASVALDTTLITLHLRHMPALEDDLESDLCRTAVWSARWARDRGNVQATQVLDSWEIMLNTTSVAANSSSVSYLVALYDQLCSLKVSAAALIGAMAMPPCSHWHAALFMTYLAGMIVHRLGWVTSVTVSKLDALQQLLQQMLHVRTVFILTTALRHHCACRIHHTCLACVFHLLLRCHLAKSNLAGFNMEACK